jgi:hypothetical protein
MTMTQTYFLIGNVMMTFVRVFGRKGEAIVDANIKALAIGRQAQR